MRPYVGLILFLALLLAACTSATSVPQSTPIPAGPSPTHLAAMPATYTPTPSPTPIPPTATPVPTLTPTLEPTIAATEITPITKGASVGAYPWSPDSHWLPYVDYTAQVLYFYEAAKANTCHLSVSVKSPDPNHFLVWLPDGRVVVQAGDQVLAGKPCFKFVPATDREKKILDQQDPFYSPDGRYQVVTQPYKGSDKTKNTTLILKDVALGKSVTEMSFYDLPRGGSSLPGYWLDAAHFLIPATSDQGPLLLIPGKPPVNVAGDLFKQPLKPGSGSYDMWLARSAVTTNPPRFHLMLIGLAGQAAANKLQIYHSETGQVEELSYLADQGAFTNDGHWLLIGELNDQKQNRALIRPLDPPGAKPEPFTDRSDMYYTWSPDGGKALGMFSAVNRQSDLILFSSPKRTFLAAWRAPDYQLSPFWSPDGKYLAASAKSYTDPGQEALFVIPVSR